MSIEKIFGLLTENQKKEIKERCIYFINKNLESDIDGEEKYRIVKVKISEASPSPKKTSSKGKAITVHGRHFPSLRAACIFYKKEHKYPGIWKKINKDGLPIEDFFPAPLKDQKVIIRKK